MTTSYFSDKAQRESIEDQYPVVRIQGLDLSREVEKLSLEKGFAAVGDFLIDVDGRCESMVRQRRAEEILRD